jgi:muramidase (phage lysozyme)
MANAIAYNPDDPTQQSFLASIRQGEVGGASTASSYQEGYGGVSTAGSSTDSYGFPQWSGSSTADGPTHAAGSYQFEPSTWDSVAAAHNLNFQNPQDQDAAAWYLAQDQYSSKTGGSLEGALQAGDYSSVQSAEASTWPSVNGNGSSPSLTQTLSNGTYTGTTSSVASSTGGASDGSAGGASNASDSTTGSGTSIDNTEATGEAAAGAGTPLDISLEPGLVAGISSWLTGLENSTGSIFLGAISSVLTEGESLFVRFGLIIVGLVVLAVALFFVLGGSSRKIVTEVAA